MAINMTSNIVMVSPPSHTGYIVEPYVLAELYAIEIYEWAEFSNDFTLEMEGELHIRAIRAGVRYYQLFDERWSDFEQHIKHALIDTLMHDTVVYDETGDVNLLWTEMWFRSEQYLTYGPSRVHACQWAWEALFPDEDWQPA